MQLRYCVPPNGVPRHHPPRHGVCGRPIGPTAPSSSQRSAALASRKTAASAASAAQTLSGEDRSHTTDVVVIGSGIGGLSCAALLAMYGMKVRSSGPLCMMAPGDGQSGWLCTCVVPNSDSWALAALLLYHFSHGGGAMWQSLSGGGALYRR